MPPSSAVGQRALGEEGQYAAADDRDQEYEEIRPQVESAARRGECAAELSRVHQRVGQGERQQDRHDDQVASRAAAHQRNGDDQGEDGQEEQIQRRDRPAGQDLLQVGRRAPGEPEQHQRRQQSSPRRLTAGPLAYGREQEAGDDRHRVAEDHLVGVPRQCAVVGLESECAAVRERPRCDQQHRRR
jgi:hypothetical protein